MIPKGEQQGYSRYQQRVAQERCGQPRSQDPFAWHDIERSRCVDMLKMCCFPLVFDSVKASEPHHTYCVALSDRLGNKHHLCFNLRVDRCSNSRFGRACSFDGFCELLCNLCVLERFLVQDASMRFARITRFCSSTEGRQAKASVSILAGHSLQLPVALRSAEALT